MIVVRVLRGVGQTLITLGVIVLLFVVYELWFTGLETAREQRRLEDELEQLWAEGGGDFPEKSGTVSQPDALPTIPLGSAVAGMRIPRFGRDWAWAVVEGVSLSVLRKGPGHYPGTQYPGQVGNFVVSGHRTTWGQPFHRVDELRPGDPIVVETRDTWYTYRVTETEIVPPTAVDVTYPVPRRRGAEPEKALLTLTSCHPKYSARQRIVVFAELAETTPKSEGRPSALEG